MYKISIVILECMILYFIVTQGKMTANPNSPEYNSIPSSGTKRNFNPSSKNSDFDKNLRQDEMHPKRNYPSGYNPNRNKPPDYNSKIKNPADYNSNNKNLSDYNSNKKNSTNHNSNNRNPAGYNQNNIYPADDNSNNRKPIDSKSNNRNHIDHNTKNRNPVNHNSRNNQPASSVTNHNYPRKLTRNNNNEKNRHHHSKLVGKPKHHHHHGKKFPHEKSGKSPHTPRNNHPTKPARNNNNPLHVRSLKEDPNSHLYTYYQTDPLKAGRIVCLYTAAKFWKSGFKPSMIPARLCTVVNYEFAKLNSSTFEMDPGNPDLDYGQGFYKKAIGLKHINPYLKVMLSLGGWNDSTKKYSDLTNSTEKVDNFVSKAVLFLKKHKFDGLDVAWEYPNCWQGAPGVNPTDKPNFAKFLQKLRKAFDPESLLLSISVSSIKREIKLAYNGSEISKAVHFINVMTYDMHGPWENKTGHISQFDIKSNDIDPTLNSKAAMKYWSSIGVPKIKLNMGIATYATTFTLKNPSKHGLGAPTKGPGKPGDLSHNGGILYYREICQYLKAGNWTEDKDQDVGSYAYSGDQWAGYDNPEMVVKKTDWIAVNGYGGLVIKDVSADDYEKKCFTKKFPLIWIAGMEFRLMLEGKQ